MKLQYLGTAAAEGVPGMFCECEVCKRSRQAGGKNIRTRSQSLIDDKMMIDFPADTYWHEMVYNMPLSKIHTCLITHSHSDHLYPEDLEMRSRGMAPVMPIDKPLTFYSCESGYNMIMETVEKDGKRILYANDTGMFGEKTWEYLKNYKKRFDLISLDCTMQIIGQYCGHLNYEEDIKTRERLCEWGMVDDKTVCILNHFSHNGGLTYDEMRDMAQKDGFMVSYDGMTVEI